MELIHAHPSASEARRTKELGALAPLLFLSILDFDECLRVPQVQVSPATDDENQDDAIYYFSSPELGIWNAPCHVKVELMLSPIGEWVIMGHQLSGEPSIGSTKMHKQSDVPVIAAPRAGH